MPGAVNLQTTLNRSVFQALPTVQKIYALIQILPTGEGVPGLMPLNFGLVLDRSGSMAGEKIRNLREAVKLVLGRMAPQDLLSLVVFDDKVDLLLPSQPLNNATQIQQQVDQIVDQRRHQHL